MKTYDELNAIINEVASKLADTQHDIGTLSPSDNLLEYEKDGWYIEVEYSCIGNYDCDDPLDPWSYTLIEATGSVDGLYVTHIDEVTGEESNFSEEVINEMVSKLDYELARIA